MIMVALLVAALCFSALGYVRYVYFISLGYAASILAMGACLLAAGQGTAAVPCLLLMLYGTRLGGYLFARELGSGSYQKYVAREIKDGKNMPLAAKLGMHFGVAVLYVLMVSPIAFRVLSLPKMGVMGSVGAVIMAAGLALESLADLQKTRAKHREPGRFVSTGLYAGVRCPNYFGEVMFWTGVFLCGIPALTSPLRLLAALVGWLGIVYIMFGGARRLELRQERVYGADPAFAEYCKRTPILLPFVPLYSVAKYKWLVG